ncbi:protein kinase domain-containing protein [Artemisia annua]|uniref:Protein kinase domain-containing protein n=1 Tax=Artemisia annua TaxID=35608 RepID=A0A2U1M6E7_ARTAN|nr:protein kinase domain-containing protein [Artemisia annua]
MGRFQAEGPKFLRLYFYPATYSGLIPNQSFFSVSSNGYSLLTNFSAFQTASFLAKKRSDAGVDGPPVPHFVKEFLIYIMYFDAKKNPKPVGMSTGPVINNDTALETVYRLNVGGGEITGNDDTGMFRSWDIDNYYIYGAAIGLTPVNNTPIMYTIDTPNYTAPELLYETQRSMGKHADSYNLTWILPVDSGIPVYKDYVVLVNNPSSHRSKQDLWLKIHPNSEVSKEYLDAYLNGLEAFKLSMNHDLSSPMLSGKNFSSRTPNLVSSRKENNNNSPPSALIIGGAGGCLVLLSVLLLLVLNQRRRTKQHTTTNNKPSLPSDCCRRFSLKQVKVATNKFNENNVIGNGGFGKVYKGYMGNAKTTVAIKRLNPSSSQGFHEFQTEIQMLSRLRHEHLVSLIGYCDDNGEMILVYDYMSRGNLREHLYKTNNPPLSWKTRLNICIGAAKGLHYLHTMLCARPVIIPWLTSEQVTLAEWGKTCYQRGTLVEIIDQNLSDQIAPGSLRKFGEVANSCLHEEVSERPTMDAVVQGLEVALQLQEACEEMGGIVGEEMLESQDLPFRMQVELTKTDDDGIEDEEIVAHQGAHS